MSVLNYRNLINEVIGDKQRKKLLVSESVLQLRSSRSIYAQAWTPTVFNHPLLAIGLAFESRFRPTIPNWPDWLVQFDSSLACFCTDIVPRSSSPLTAKNYPNRSDATLYSLSVTTMRDEGEDEDEYHVFSHSRFVKKHNIPIKKIQYQLVNGNMRNIRVNNDCTCKQIIFVLNSIRQRQL